VALASFAIAYKILYLVNGALEDSKYISLVFLKNQRDRKRLSLFFFMVALFFSGLLLVLGKRTVGSWPL